jgi:hypothetical protein
MWSSGQSSWLKIQRFGFSSLLYEIFWVVVGLEVVHSTSWVQLRSYFEERVAALVAKAQSTAAGNRHADYVAYNIRKMLTHASLTTYGRSVSIVRSRAQATEFTF